MRCHGACLSNSGLSRQHRLSCHRPGLFNDDGRMTPKNHQPTASTARIGKAHVSHPGIPPVLACAAARSAMAPVVDAVDLAVSATVLAPLPTAPRRPALPSMSAKPAGKAAEMFAFCDVNIWARPEASNPAAAFCCPSAPITTGVKRPSNEELAPPPRPRSGGRRKCGHHEHPRQEDVAVVPCRSLLVAGQPGAA